MRVRFTIAFLIFFSFHWSVDASEFKKLQMEQVQFNFGSGKAVTSESIYLSAKSKGKPVILDFWASWCTKCMAKLPTLLKLKKEFGAKFSYFAINSGESDKILNKIKRKVEKKRIRYHKDLKDFLSSYAILKDPQLEISKNHFQVEVIPMIMLIDKNGKIIAKAQSDSTLQNLIEMARKL